MPITGEVDISGILANLGDPKHGLSAARPKTSGLEDRDEPYRAAYGTIDMSMSMGLQVVPKIIWDVNGYYRALGIDWPYKPTKRQLREGYRDSGGPNDERRTYYFKQLLDPAIRAEYDAMPLGSKYRDKYIIEEDKRKLAALAKEVSEEEGKIVTVQDLMDEYDREHPELEPLPPSTHIWNWGFYAQYSRKYDTEILERWQEYLTKAFAARQLAPVISIGYIGRIKEDFVLVRHEGRDIFLLNEATNPTPELAETAVSSFKAHRQRGNK